MNSKTVDRRTRKTKAILSSALIKLLMEKELREISVTELTELADVNRGTFYLHFKDIYDLYDHMENEVLINFKTQLLAEGHGCDVQPGIYPIVLWAFKFIAENAEMSMAILKQGERVFLEKMFDMGRKKSLEEWHALRGKNQDKLHDFYFSFVTSGCVGLIKQWLHGGTKEKPETMAEMANELIMGCLRSGNQN